MDEVIASLVRCESGGILRLSMFILGGVASFATIAATIYGLYRRLRPRAPSKKEKQAAMAIRNIGNDLVGNRDYQSAVQLYDVALTLHPRSAETCYRRGLAYKEWGHLQKAETDWLYAIEILPTHAGAREAMRSLPTFGDSLDA
jgi:tetratricopeptide (TPR) repeat protein